MYIQYTLEYDHILDIFAKYNKSKKLKKHLRQKRKEGKPLTNHLILPIQRVPRYMLLLQDLIKRTPESHKNFKGLNEALDIINNVAVSINERKREIENMSQCLQIMENVRDLNRNIVEPHRKYLNQFLFRKKENKKSRQFFVFNDLVIVCSLNMRVKMVLEMKFVELKLQNENEFILLTAKGKPKPFELHTAQNKPENIKQFEELIIKSRSELWDKEPIHVDHESGSVIMSALQVKVESAKHQLGNAKESAKNQLKGLKESAKGKKKKIIGMLHTHQQ